jgi:hypothetical protein
MTGGMSYWTSQAEEKTGDSLSAGEIIQNEAQSLVFLLEGQSSNQPA